jgi:hypothetical protein
VVTFGGNPITTGFTAEGEVSFRLELPEDLTSYRTLPVEGDVLSGQDLRTAMDIMHLRGTASDGSATASRIQKQEGKMITVKARVTAGEDLTAKGRGRVVVGKRSYKLEPQTKSLTADDSKDLRLRPQRISDAQRIVKALRKGERVRAKMKVTLTDDAGNIRSIKLSVKLKR